MSDGTLTKGEKAKIEMRVQLGGLFLYWGFRWLGATKKHAWERARVAAANAIVDKVVEWSGIKHPNGIPPGHMQITYEGGPANREVCSVEVCGTIELTSGGAVYRYARTDRKRGDSIIFELKRITQ